MKILVLLMPGKGKRQFRLQERDDVSGRYTTLREPRLQTINELLVAGAIDIVEAKAQAKRLLAQIRHERGERRPIFNQGNYRLLDTFWKGYKAQRDLIDPDTMYNDFRRAVEAVGDLPLASVGQDELQGRLGALKGERHRRIVARLNTLLRYLGRDWRLRAAKPEVREVAYLTESEVKVVCLGVSEELSRLVRVLFVTGLRLGEAYGLTPQAVRSDRLVVKSQVDRHGLRRQTKTRRQRAAFFLPHSSELIQSWIEYLRSNEKRGRLALSQEFRRACKKQLKRDLCLHDLRHSYAIHLVSRGVSISLVAQSLGNSVLVCERYYAGFVLSDESIETIRRTLAKAESPQE
jgi:integrase